MGCASTSTVEAICYFKMFHDGTCKFTKSVVTWLIQTTRQQLHIWTPILPSMRYCFPSTRPLVPTHHHLIDVSSRWSPDEFMKIPMIPWNQKTGNWSLSWLTLLVLMWDSDSEPLDPGYMTHRWIYALVYNRFLVNLYRNAFQQFSLACSI